jgi:hypothetical protein
MVICIGRKIVHLIPTIREMGDIKVFIMFLFVPYLAWDLMRLFPVFHLNELTWMTIKCSSKWSEALCVHCFILFSSCKCGNLSNFSCSRRRNSECHRIFGGTRYLSLCPTEGKRSMKKRHPFQLFYWKNNVFFTLGEISFISLMGMDWLQQPSFLANGG